MVQPAYIFSMLRTLLVGIFFLAAACSNASRPEASVENGTQVDGVREDGASGAVDEAPVATPDVAGSVQPSTPERPAARRTGPSMADTADEADASSIVSGDAELDVGASVASYVGGTSALRYRARLVTNLPYTTYEFFVSNTGSLWQEKFLLQVPSTPPSGPTPLLVLFHKYGSSHGDVLNTSFPAEADARGWYLLSPLGGHQKNFGTMQAQINVRAALNLTLHLFSQIDRDRIYGVGFSMGGGALASFAARQIDADGPMFAAIVNHTGAVSLAHAHYFDTFDDDDSDDNMAAGTGLEPQEMMEFLLGGSPATVPYQYQRFSTIDLDPIQSSIGQGTDMSRNLAHVPTYVWFADNDPNAYLREQTTQFDTHVRPQNVANNLATVVGSTHSWSTLDDTAVCDWLALRTLTVPTSGSTLADEDGRFFHFTIAQDAAGAFTPFTWNWDVATSTFDLSATSNLQSVSMDLVAMGAPALTGAFTFHFATTDGLGDTLQLTNVPTAPTSVTRDGISEIAIHDPVAQTLTIVETDGAALHTWVVTF